jgi:hypothetical protein
MVLRTITGMLLMLFMATSGYAADSVSNLALRAAPPSTIEKKSPPLKVAIIQFEDVRPLTASNPDRQPRIGLRTHIDGNATYYHIKDGPIGAAVAQALASALKQRGVDAWVVGAGDGRSEQSADVTIRGQVLDFWTHANSRLGGTRLTTKVDLAVDATNHHYRRYNDSDRSGYYYNNSVRKVVTGRGTHDETFYKAADLEQLMNATLNVAFAKYFENTVIEQDQFRNRQASR